MCADEKPQVLTTMRAVSKAKYKKLTSAETEADNDVFVERREMVEHATISTNRYLRQRKKRMGKYTCGIEHKQMKLV